MSVFTNSKGRILGLCLGLAIFFSIAAFRHVSAKAVAAPAPTAEVSKTGIVSMQEALATTNEGKIEFGALQKRFAPKQEEIKAQGAEVESLKKKLQAPGITEVERKSLNATIDAKQKALQKSFTAAQGDFQQAERDVVNRLGQKMMVTIDKYAKANGYSVILDVSSETTPVLWALPTANITKDVVEAYNAEAPAAAAPTPAPKP
ncbi:MAG: OmpH family outer membrane protein [Candidatus Acidiferrales bacterium]